METKRSTPRFALVTGGGSGLGRAVALKLAFKGWQVAVADIHRPSAEETCRLASSAGGSARCHELDVCSVEQWEQLRRLLERQHPCLDLLVNNAGVCGAGEVGQCTLENWRWILETNLLGTVHGCHTMLDWLKLNPAGAHIFNVASLAGLVYAPSMAAYNCSKAGIVALGETMHAELAHTKVRVTVVCPGFFATNLLKQGRFATPAQQAAAIRLMQRGATSAERVADAIFNSIGTRRLYLITPLRARLAWRLKRLAPMAVARLLAALYRRETSAFQEPPHVES